MSENYVRFNVTVNSILCMLRIITKVINKKEKDVKGNIRLLGQIQEFVYLESTITV